ncbi:MAG: outer membrane beta-barrel protein, partial [Bacteroidales bacterium]|nr:outer membrane beta-barrel protein [Bacteroidales bacterium]
NTDASYQNSMSFVGKAGIDGENPESYLDINNFDPNRYTALSASERFRFTYRDDHVELTLGGRVRYSQSWYQMTTTEPNAAFTNTVDGSVNYTTNNKWSFVTDGRYTFYKGYNEGYNTPSFVWNAEINKQIFKGRATVALRCWDILNQSRNTYRTTAENYYQDVSNNTLGRYIILSLTYRFGTFGDKGNRMMGPGGPHGHGPMGPPRF